MTNEEIVISREHMDSGYWTTSKFSPPKMVRVLSASEKHRLLNAVLQSITAIERLKSEASYVLSVTEGYGIIKTIPNGCDELLNTLNEILASAHRGIENANVERNAAE